jgi:phosphopantetheinyl transferase (holo-ACP synthase)
MIGNDVVDLGDADTQAGARHPRFDRRVFAASERRRLERDDSDPRLRWILWAAKESTYKVARRSGAADGFAPVRFVVTLDAEWRGDVCYRGDRYPVRVSVRTDHVHAVATGPGLACDEIAAGVRRLLPGEAGDRSGDAASREARSFALEEIAARTGSPRESLAIERRERIPRLVDRTGREALDLSLSHHGRFVAYACASATRAMRFAG